MGNEPIRCGYADVRECARLVRSQPETFNNGFAVWLESNATIWLRFRREADRVRRRRSHYSARAILHFIRHETVLADDGEEFKINNNASRDLARLYMLTTPGAMGFFETREVMREVA